MREPALAQVYGRAGKYDKALPLAEQAIGKIQPMRMMATPAH